MDGELERTYESLAAWCRERDYAGHDPFDALNSRLFQATPFKHSRTARIIWTQLFKRSPVNFRKIARVPVGRNAKGTALFALAALANFRRVRTEEAETEARRLLDDLLSARLEGWSGAAWGYNFDWQSRAFFGDPDLPIRFGLPHGILIANSPVYRFGAHLAVEGAYGDLGAAAYTASMILSDGVNTAPATISRHLSSKGFMVSALGIAPFGSRWEAYGRGGLIYADTKLSVTAVIAGSGNTSDDSSHSSDWLLGVGVGCEVSDHFSIRLEYQKFKNLGDSNTGETDVDTIDVRVLYRL